MALSDAGRCPVCDASTERLDYRIDDVPVRSMTIHDDREEAMSVPRGSIDLAACLQCGLVFNASFDPRTQLEDSADYEETQAFSGTFQGYSSDLARRLIERHDLDDGLILEIGCGKAGFLATMCGLSRARAVGVDPTSDPTRVPDELRGRLRVLRDRYRNEHGAWASEADLICCRHTLEHLIDPLEILEPLRRHLDGHPETPVFFDVPSGGHVFEVGGCWDVYYEHCMYYRDQSFVRLLEGAGFEIRGIGREYEDQYLCAEVVIAEPRRTTSLMQPPDLAPLHRMRSAWSDWFASDARGDVLLWGSGSRAVGFLGAVPDHDRVKGIVDINPRRRGRWMPGFHRPILAPDDLAEVEAEAIVVMNPAYTGEIGDMIRRLGLNIPLLRVDRPPA